MAEGDRSGIALGQKLFAELVGTFFLTLVAAGGEMVAYLHPDELGSTAKAAAPGMVVMALIYAAGDVSGAHFNPAVTAAFAIRRVFPWMKVPMYWCAQILGAIGAALALRYLLGDVRHLGATEPKVDDTKALLVEIVLTTLLVTVILNAANRHSLIGTDAALPVGATIALCGFIGGPLSGASMNPARSIGPSIVAGSWHFVWLYVAGPLLGALAAALIAFALHPHPNGDEAEAADGERTDSTDGRG